MSDMAKLPTNVDHEALYQELAALIQKHSGKLSEREILAVASNMVGKIIAMQDQHTMTVDEAMSIVANNIELGSQQAIDELMKSKGSA